MASTLQWLDHSDADRRRMLAIVDLFRDQGTVDELGLQAIWDAFAGWLFPGTGTVQTRARYFVIVPWAYQAANHVPASRAAATVRRVQERVIESLLAGDSGQRGVIGRVSRKHLRRMPSAIYWSGLERWGIRIEPGSSDQLLNATDHRSARTAQRDDDGELIDAAVRTWHPSLPPEPEGFPDEPMLLDLEAKEARFLRDRIHDSCTGSMLDVLLDPDMEVGHETYPWFHTDLAAFPDALKNTLHHAQRYSEAMHGAALLYNLILARQKKVPELEQAYDDRLATWTTELQAQGAAHSSWDRSAFLAFLHQANARVRPLALTFVDDWCTLLTNDGFTIGSNPRAELLVTKRERFLKQGLARIGNRQLLDRWNGHSGDEQYEFRWSSAKTILRDIKAGLELEGP